MVREMRAPILAILFAVVGMITTLILERYVSEYAPEWAWRLAYGLCIIGGLSIALLFDPICSYLSDFKEHEFASTAIVALASGIFVATIWLLLIIGFPSSKSYMDLRVKRWIKSLQAPWTAKEAPNPRAYFGFYIDNTDGLGVGAFRPKDPENDHYVIFDATIDLAGNRQLLFENGDTCRVSIILSCDT